MAMMIGMTTLPDPPQPQQLQPAQKSPPPKRTDFLRTLRNILITISFVASGLGYFVFEIHDRYCAAEPQPTPIAQPAEPPTPQEIPYSVGSGNTPPPIEQITPPTPPMPPTPPPDQITETRVERTGGRGGDGTPQVNITVTLNSPIPAGYTGASVMLHTNQDWPQAWTPVAPGATTIVLERIYLHHSLNGQSEYLQVTLEGDAVEPITLRAAVQMR